MVISILPPILQPAVQALMSTRRTQGGNLRAVSKRRLANAQRCLVCQLAERMRKPITYTVQPKTTPTLYISTTFPNHTACRTALWRVRHHFYISIIIRKSNIYHHNSLRFRLFFVTLRANINNTCSSVCIKTAGKFTVTHITLT